jgi:hypothetical protein
LKCNEGEPTKFGPIFTKLTFLNMAYMKNTNNENYTFCEKNLSRILYQDIPFYEIHTSKLDVKCQNWIFLKPSEGCTYELQTS